MKKLLLAFLLIATATTLNAQTASSPRGNEEKLALVSKTNELEASLSRNQPQLLKTVLPEVTTMMQNHLQRISSDIQKLNGQAKEEMGMKIQKETALLNEFQKLSSDPVKNKKDLISKARAFIESY